MGVFNLAVFIIEILYERGKILVRRISWAAFSAARSANENACLSRDARKAID
jgi:hypothetical protein